MKISLDYDKPLNIFFINIMDLQGVIISVNTVVTPV